MECTLSPASVLGHSTGHFIMFYLPKRHPSGGDFCSVLSKLGGISGVIAPFESPGGVCPRVKETKEIEWVVNAVFHTKQHKNKNKKDK